MDKDSVIQPPDAFLEYDCREKKGLLGVQWTVLNADIDLALMTFDLSSMKPDNCKWQIQCEEISNVIKVIQDCRYAMYSLSRALSAVPENAFYIQAPVISVMKTTSNSNADEGKLEEKHTTCSNWQTTTTLDIFSLKLKNDAEYLPLGKQLLNYTLKGESFSLYSIHVIDQNEVINSKFIEWYSRFRTFLRFFINSASITDTGDSNWAIYLVCRIYKNKNEKICYASIGFSKVYLHNACQDKKRAAISQILVLPPYQRKGHGRRLLKAIYNDLRKDSCLLDITAENPSDKFTALRDLVSLELCHKYLPDLFSKASILKTERVTKEMINKAHDTCKLTEQETQRVYEISFLRSINQNEEEQMKRFRSTIEQGLSLLVIDQYDHVLQHYKNILRAFHKYHMTTFFISDILS